MVVMHLPSFRAEYTVLDHGRGHGVKNAMHRLIVSLHSLLGLDIGLATWLAVVSIAELNSWDRQAHTPASPTLSRMKSSLSSSTYLLNQGCIL